MGEGALVFRVHAIRRMFERKISVADIRQVLGAGEVIEAYPDDKPYPSRLLLGWIGGRPLHVVAANNPEEGAEIVIIIAYEPDPAQWNQNFRRRK